MGAYTCKNAGMTLSGAVSDQSIRDIGAGSVSEPLVCNHGNMGRTNMARTRHMHEHGRSRTFLDTRHFTTPIARTRVPSRCMFFFHVLHGSPCTSPHGEHVLIFTSGAPACSHEAYVVLVS